MKIATRRVLIVFTLITNLFHSADAQNGQIWGVTSREGTNNIGTIFKMDGEGNNFTIQKNFLSVSQGINPESAPTIAHNGKLYGVTRFGGSQDLGVIYEFDPIAKTYIKKIDFTGANGRNPRGTLLQATNGKLYGVAVAKDATEVTGPYEIFEYDPISNSIRAIFKSAESRPFSSLIQASNGKIYGIGTQELVELDPVSGSSQSWLNEFQFPFRNYFYNSSYFKGVPAAEQTLIEASDGKLYGVQSIGVLFSFDPVTKAFEDLGQFFPSLELLNGRMIEVENGKLLWVTNGSKRIVEYDINQKIFTNGVTFSELTGVDFFCDLNLAPNGKLYGFSYNGGTNHFGSIFEYDPINDAITTKFDFSRETGINPTYGALAWANDKFYGTTATGGNYNSGVIYSFDYATSEFTKLYDFVPSVNGAQPIQLTQLPNGKFIGTTNKGGLHNSGVLFEYNPADDHYRKLHDFDPDITGAKPFYSPTLSSNGKLYGLAGKRGISRGGILYELDLEKNTVQKKLEISGNFSRFGMVQSDNGKLYGIVDELTNNITGVNKLFEYNPTSNTLQQKIEVGMAPEGALTISTKGTILGTTLQGGASSTGSIFEFNPLTDKLENTIDFLQTNFSIPPVSPYGGLTLASDLKYYGMTVGGQVYQYDPLTNQILFRTEFDPSLGGHFGALLKTPSGKLYGIGTSSVIEYDPATNILIKKRQGNFSDFFNYGSLLFVKNNQGITFNSLSTKTYGDASFTLTATSTSGLPISYISSNPAIASITGSTVTILGAGTVTITAQQAGNDSYNSAPDIEQTLIIEKATPPITWNNPADIVYGIALGSDQFNATSTIEGIFNYSPVSGTKLNAGENQLLSVTFTPSDLDNYTTTSTTVVINVLKATQQITMDALADKTLGDAEFMISAISNSDLLVSFTTTSDKITLSGNKVSLIKAGRASITATQDGNANYESTTISRSFCIKPAKPFITINNANLASPTLTSTSLSGNQWFRNGTLIQGAIENTYTAVEGGNYQVQVTVDDCVSEFSNNQILIITGDASSYLHQNQIEVYPNPGTDWIDIKLGHENKLKKIRITDITGREIELRKSFDTSLQFDIHHYSKGLYFITVEVENARQMLRFIKQ